LQLTPRRVRCRVGTRPPSSITLLQPADFSKKILPKSGVFDSGNRAG
jgi:hypothetical protein